MSLPEKLQVDAEPINDAINHTKITIFCTKLQNTHSIKHLLNAFLSFINNIIGAKTNVNYHITPVVNNKIVIPIYPYTNDEIQLNAKALITKRYKTILKFLSNMPLEHFNQRLRWIIRSLLKQKINFAHDFTIKAIIDNEPVSEDVIPFSFDKIVHETFKQYKLRDGSLVNILIDPYMSNYGVFVDLSVKFEDMGMGYNALHLYEHLCIKAWTGLSSEHIVDINGATFPTGISYVYIVLNNFRSFKEHASASINWVRQTRRKEFWQSKRAEEFIRTETQRTISETREERVLNATGRTDPKGYNYQYNTDIFHYWANRPFNMLLTSPQEFSFEKHNLRVEDVRRPPNIHFERMPLDVIKAKENQQLRISRASTSSIVNDVYSSKLANVLYGINCHLVPLHESSSDENLSVYNSVLLPLLILARHEPEEKIKKYVSNNLIPADAEEFSSTPAYNIGMDIMDTSVSKDSLKKKFFCNNFMNQKSCAENDKSSGL
jgi:hypothetical protein